MIYIPGELVALATFPGVIFHEMAHKIFCDINDVPVFKVVYFKIEQKRSGYVIHGNVKTFGQALSIALAPLIVNGFICMLSTFPLALTFLFETQEAGFVSQYTALPCYLSGWIGISAAMNALPSAVDVATLSEFAHSNTTKNITNFIQSFVKIFSAPMLNLLFTVSFIAFCEFILIKLFLSLGIL